MTPGRIYWRQAPVAGTVCLATVIVSLSLSAQPNLDSWETWAKWGLLPAEKIRAGSYWPLVTSVFLHLELWHLFFNVYWLWTLGASLERILGSRNWIGFFLLAAVVSSGIQLAWSDSTGIGASGVVYAIFGFLWKSREKHPEVWALLDLRTVSIFLVWLVGCIAATALGIWEVGNAAHVSGLALGVCIAAICNDHPRRTFAYAGAGLLISAAIIPLFWHPWSTS